MNKVKPSEQSSLLFTGQKKLIYTSSEPNHLPRCLTIAEGHKDKTSDYILLSYWIIWYFYYFDVYLIL